ncbi:hypothetical protein CDAR_65981 [Caerostris darwini]|uniref:Uncharacterized protein n=1 Tax=Caerostris darwini TaxID=1538125 RepID=A0AAV4UC25_9ARAC|nr:hypothetical protein CDAR_65981 [Caerostris darwini]
MSTYIYYESQPMSASIRNSHSVLVHTRGVRSARIKRIFTSINKTGSFEEQKISMLSFHHNNCWSHFLHSIQWPIRQHTATAARYSTSICDDILEPPHYPCMIMLNFINEQRCHSIVSHICGIRNELASRFTQFDFLL